MLELYAFFMEHELATALFLGFLLILIITIGAYLAVKKFDTFDKF
jgi:hypothetical protein